MGRDRARRRKSVRALEKAAQTAWDALPGTADAATTAAARQSIGQGALGTLEGLGTLLGPSAEFTQAAYISGNAEAIALVEQMQQSQRAAIGAIGDSVKSAWNEAYARNGAVGASAMVLATLGIDAAGGKGLGKVAGTAADIVRAAKTPMEAAKKLDDAIAAAKAAGASADEIALLDHARAERLAQARREAAQGKDGVVITAKKDKPKSGAWDSAPNWERWERDGGKVTQNTDGSVTYVRKDGVEVTYNMDGYPDFSPHAKQTVKLDKVSGDHYWDFKAANETIGLKGSKPPNGFTWHHHQDGKTMLLVPQEIHNASMGGFPHAGGVSANKGQ